MDIRNRITQIQQEIQNLNSKLQQLQQEEQGTLRNIIAKQGALQELQNIQNNEKSRTK